MQLLYTHPDGRHLCLLDAAEVAQLQRTAGATSEPELAPLPPAAQAAWPDTFLRQLTALPLEPATYNAIARAARAHPHLFLDQHGRRMTVESWGRAVLAGRWTAPGVGPARLQEVRRVLAEVVRREGRQ